MLEHCCGNMLPSSHKSISEVRHRCWLIRPGLQSVFQIISKVFNGVEVRALCRPVMFFHTDLDKQIRYGPRYVYGGIVMLTEERRSRNCCLIVGRKQLSRLALYAVALRFPFTGTKGPEPFLLHQTVQVALCIGAGRVPYGEA